MKISVQWGIINRPILQIVAKKDNIYTTERNLGIDMFCSTNDSVEFRK